MPFTSVRTIFVPFIALVLYGSMLALCGCDRGSRKNDTAGTVREESAVLAGSLLENVQNVQSGRFFDPCEVGLRDKQLEIAKALDKRQALINSAVDNSFETKIWRVVQVGKHYFREAKTSLSHKSGWIDNSYSWPEIIDDYNNIKDINMDDKASIIPWVSLNSRVRSILADDVDRVVDGYVFNLGKDDGPTIQSAYQKVLACSANGQCASPGLTDAERAKVLQNAIWAQYLVASEKATTAEGGSRSLSYLVPKLANAALRYSMYYNSTVQRPSKDTLIVPLVAGDFADIPEQMAKYIEDIWSSTNLRVKVLWSDATLPNVFTLVSPNGIGGRSFVRWDLLQVHLFDYVKAHAIAHEFGHVLGFKDHYYTTWHPEKCGYVEQITNEDLMSDSSRGLVTNAEWADLDKAYPYIDSSQPQPVSDATAEAVPSTPGAQPPTAVPAQ